MLKDSKAFSGFSTGDIQRMLSLLLRKTTLLKRLPSLADVGNVAALMASELRRHYERDCRQRDLRPNR
jgi:hypothetical protein